MSNRKWALVFVCIALLCALSLLLMPGGGETVGIWQRGELLYTITPALVTEPYTITLQGESGESHIHVGKDGIYMEDAACPLQFCVRHGPLGSGATPIVCLPERIVIRYLRTDESVDAVTG